MKEYIIRFVPSDDEYCLEKDIFVTARTMLDALNFVLETERVKKITFFRRLTSAL